MRIRLLSKMVTDRVAAVLARSAALVLRTKNGLGGRRASATFDQRDQRRARRREALYRGRLRANNGREQAQRAGAQSSSGFPSRGGAQYISLEASCSHQSIGGRRLCQSVAFWNACPARSTSASSMCLPTIWKPTGSPSPVFPPGSVSVGWPLMLKGAAKRKRASTTRPPEDWLTLKERLKQ
jgi:hypothetical protein